MFGYGLIVNANLTALSRDLQRLHAAYSASNLVGRTANTHCGFETRQDPKQYDYDGLKRGADPAHPYLVFQYTFKGWGSYTTHNQTYKILPGTAFNAFIPSPHRYFLPQESAEWTFFWLLVSHPYVVDRMSRRQVETGPVFPLTASDGLFLQAVTLFEHICEDRFSDEYAEEQMLFSFMLEYERYAHRTNYQQPKRDQLLSEVRTYVLKMLHRPVGSAELGALWGMSRSNFAHYFKGVTGLSPAKFIRSVRLEEAAFRLLHTEQILETIAHETGFADATHFCKAFRQFYHLSPGQYRRQIRG